MFITKTILHPLIEQYGTPQTKSFEIAVDQKEFDRIKSSQKNGREHDVTLYIFNGDKVAVIAKHFYPPEMYRAPSGGINPGEDFVEGAKREAHEETGCEIELEQFILRTNVTFYLVDDPQKIIEWHSYVFKAKYLSGDLEFTDTNEIREARWATLPEFERFSEIMRSTDIGGLHYRAALHEAVLAIINPT